MTTLIPNSMLQGPLGGGATAYAALTDGATIDLPSTNVALGNALASKSPYKQAVGISTVIPLDIDGNGKYMLSTVLSTNSVFSVGPNPVEQGNCNFALVGNGTNTPDFSAFVNANAYTYSPALNANNIYAVEYSYGTALLYGVLGTSAAPTGFLLLESGFYLLKEDGGKFIL